MSKKIIVTGPSGKLGSEFVRWGIEPYSLRDGVQNLPDCDVVINCAAYTDVDRSETPTGNQAAYYSNVRLVRDLLSECDKRSIRIIHFSTDFVFDGIHGPYTEKDRPVRSVNHYGQTKLLADMFINDMRINDLKHTVIRTTGLYGHKTDFVHSVLDAAYERKKFLAAYDFNGNMTYIPHLVEATLEYIRSDQFAPILNLASTNVVSRYRFALMVLTAFGRSDLDSLIVPVAVSQLHFAARRPRNAGLVVELAQRMNIPVYSVMQGLNEYAKTLEA
jgi:dTDP-4-dehydrorhamnose reductase